MIRIVTFYQYAKARERDAVMRVHAALDKKLSDDKLFSEDLLIELESAGFSEARLHREDRYWHVLLDGRPLMSISRDEHEVLVNAPMERHDPAPGLMSIEEAARRYRSSDGHAFNPATLRVYATAGLLHTTGRGRGRRVSAEAMEQLVAMPFNSGDLRKSLHGSRLRRRIETTRTTIRIRPVRSSFSIQRTLDKGCAKRNMGCAPVRLMFSRAISSELSPCEVGGRGPDRVGTGGGRYAIPQARGPT